MRGSVKSSTMAKPNIWDEDVKVPDYLQKGVEFQVCQDTFISGLQPIQKCLVKVDEYGFFLYWKSQEQEGQLLDCSQIREVCSHGYQTKDQKAYGTLEGAAKNGPSPAADRIIILVCGVDLVNYSTFLLLAEDVETAQKWMTALRNLIHNPLHNNICLMTALKKHWMKLCFSANRYGEIPVKSITRPFSSGRNHKIAFLGLKELGLPNSKTEFIELKEFTFERFYQLYQKVCHRSDTEQVFESLTGGAKCKYVEVGPLAQWLNEHQRDPRLNEILFPMYDHKRAKQLIENHEPDPEYAKKGRLTFEGFTRYLSSLENSPIYRERLVVFEDMEQPLCHYFINSSHNTYLSGRQFGGRSSAEIYRQVLLTGCRCIELDCWDGKGEYITEPIITHGKAMCSDVLFREVIIAINETAFVTSEYPLILSFENHCSKPQQLKMAKYCDEIFGEHLLGKPLDDCPLEATKPLPSPNMLKRKIIIKNKRLKSDVEKMQLERYYKHEEIPEEEEDEVSQDSLSIEEAHPELSRLKSDPSCVALDNNNVQNEQPVVHEPISKSDSVKTNGSGGKEEGLKKIESVSELKGGKTKMKKIEQLTEEDEKELLRNYKYVETSSTNIHPVLSSLINYCQSVKFQGFEYAEEQSLAYHMSSFSESAGISLLKTSAIEFVNYNKRQLSRIYPRGNRVDSSNYMPQVFWNAGCQLVSLNFQTSDLSMQLNQGKYEHNGMCGYLLKPEFMRRDDRTFDPFSESPVDGVIAAHCSVQVISGMFLSDKQIGTYVEVDMYGLPTDTIRKEHKTRLVPSNGLNPVYNSEQFVFRKVILPNLALMRFAVHDENGKLLGQRVIPLDALQCGYRHISLRSASGQMLDPATLFCNIVLKSYVPDGLSDFVNALADPKKYLSIAEARATQMRNMGIDEDDLAENGKPNGTRNGKESLKQRHSGSESDKKSSSSFHTSESDAGLNHQQSINSGDDKSTKKSMVTTHRQYLPSSNHMVQQNPVKDLMQRTPVTVEMLMEDPAYLKLVAAQTKEIQRLMNKRSKEHGTLERKHQEKLNTFIAKMEQSDTVPANSLCCFAPKIRANAYSVNGDFKTRLNSLHQDDRQKAIALQMSHKETETAVAQSYNESVTSLNDCHKEQQIDALQRALTLSHQDALIKLKEAQEKEMAGLTQHQTKSSMMSTRGITLDKSIKRAEKDRRIREMSSSNAKKFMEERQMVSSRHTRELEKIRKEQEEEVKELNEAINSGVERVIRKRMEDWEKRRLGEHPFLEKTDSDNVFRESQCPVITE